MEFSEAMSPWSAVPSWALFLLNFGFSWVNRKHETRNIAVISMPTDSAAAGLVALGALRKYLDLPNANDASSHYETLLELAKLNDPEIKLRRGNQRKSYIFDGIDENGIWVKQLDSNSFLRYKLSPLKATDWRINGEPPIVLMSGQNVPHEIFYNNLLSVPNNIISSNLSKSFSKVCLTSRLTGGTSTKKIMDSIRFRYSNKEVELSDLLTIHTWSPNTISRLLFYNSRTRSFDRAFNNQNLVISDGDTSFLNSIDNPDFQKSDIIGVIHRTIDRDRLEAIGAKIENLRQWYNSDSAKDLPDPPNGIYVCILKRA